MKTIPLSKAKAGFSKLIDDVGKTRSAYRITKGGEAEAALISMEEYESLVETIEILSDPDLMKQIKQSRLDIEKGRLVSHKEVFG
jgi:prevent-host-death family protein